MSFNYKRNFADDRKSLSGSFTSSHEKNRQNTDINTQDYDISHLNLGDPFLERTHNYEHGATHTLQLDYALPVHKNLILETGYKGLFRSLNADFETANLENGNYIIQTGSSNIFNFMKKFEPPMRSSIRRHPQGPSLIGPIQPVCALNKSPTLVKPRIKTQTSKMVISNYFPMPAFLMPSPKINPSA